MEMAAKPKRRSPTVKCIHPSEATLRKLILEEHTPVIEVAKQLGYGPKSWSNVYYWCRRYGIKVDLRPNHRVRHQEFSSEQKALVYGTMLGDGYIRPGKRHAHLVMGHSPKQRDYLEWKRQQLAPFFTREAAEGNSTGSFSTRPTLYHASVAHPWLTELREQLYPGGRKTVTRDWLEQLTPLSMAVWFMDDGSLNRTYGTMFISTQGFSLEEHELMQTWFLERWGIPTIIEPRRNGKFGLRVNTSVAQRLRDLIAPHVPHCMRYKVEYQKG